MSREIPTLLIAQAAHSEEGVHLENSIVAGIVGNGLLLTVPILEAVPVPDPKCVQCFPKGRLRDTSELGEEGAELQIDWKRLTRSVKEINDGSD